MVALWQNARKYARGISTVGPFNLPTIGAGWLKQKASLVPYRWWLAGLMPASSGKRDRRVFGGSWHDGTSSPSCQLSRMTPVPLTNPREIHSAVNDHDNTTNNHHRKLHIKRIHNFTITHYINHNDDATDNDNSTANDDNHSHTTDSNSITDDSNDNHYNSRENDSSYKNNNSESEEEFEYDLSLPNRQVMNCATCKRWVLANSSEGSSFA